MSKNDGIAFGKPFYPGLALSAGGGVPSLSSVESRWAEYIGNNYNVWLDINEGTRWGIYLRAFAWRRFYAGDSTTMPSNPTDPNDPAYDWSFFEQYQNLDMVVNEPNAQVHITIDTEGKTYPRWVDAQGGIMIQGSGTSNPREVPKWQEPFVQDFMIDFLTAFAARANDYGWFGWFAFEEDNPGGSYPGWHEGRARYVRHAHEVFTNHMVFMQQSAGVWDHLPTELIGHMLDDQKPGAGSCGSSNAPYSETNNDCSSSGAYGKAQGHCGTVENPALSPARPTVVDSAPNGINVVGTNVRTDSPFGPLPAAGEQSGEFDMNASVYLWYGSGEQRNTGVSDEFGTNNTLAGGTIPNMCPMISTTFSAAEWKTGLDRFAANGRKMVPALPWDWLTEDEPTGTEITVPLNTASLIFVPYAPTLNITLHLDVTIGILTSSLQIVENVFTAGADAGDTTAPTVPSVSLSAYTPTSITVIWTNSTDSESGLSHYNVSLNGSLIAATTQNTYTFTGLSSNTEYRINVTSVDNAGNESADSDPLVITTTVTEIPDPPEISATAVSATQVNIRWSPADSVTFTKYVVYRDDVQVGVTTQLVHTDLRLNPNRQYKYQVIAMDADGNETDKSESFYITTDPRGNVVEWDEIDDAS